MIDYEQLHTRWTERSDRLRKANDANRDTIFRALAAQGIERIEMSFDGYGDSGQIDDLAVTGGTGCLTGDIAVIQFWKDSDEKRTCPLAEAIEDLCYALLEQEHYGWQDNDGAYGTFVSDVAARTVTLECHTRYTAYETSEHSFGEA